MLHSPAPGSLLTLRELLARHDLLAYAEAFEAQGIPLEDCAALTDEDLKATVGMARYTDRKRFREAVATMPGAAPSPADALSGATRISPSSTATPTSELAGATRVQPNGPTPTGSSLPGPT